MDEGSQPTLGQFEAFFPEYLRACAAKDRDFIRGLLPDGIGNDEFEFIVESSAEFAEAMSASGAAPAFEKNGRRYEAVFREEEEGASGEWRIDFYFGSGKWLKYDPEAATEEQGWASN